MVGGAGDDRYYVDAPGDVVIEDTDSGHDRIYSKLDLTLDADLEDLFLQGTADLRGTGNAADNRLNGNQGRNILNGLAGDDRLYGKDGDDVLTGGLGNDTLHGGRGGDQMIGGAGDDRYYVDALADSVIEDADAGYDRLYSTIDTTLAAHVEVLTLQGEGHRTGIGNALDNRLNGNRGDNQLRGEGGNDRLYGRDGVMTISTAAWAATNTRSVAVAAGIGSGRQTRAPKAATATAFALLTGSDRMNSGSPDRAKTWSPGSSAPMTG